MATETNNDFTYTKDDHAKADFTIMGEVSGNVTLTTAAGNSFIYELDGNDTITTGAGNSTITTGVGDSTITTGAGNSTITTGAGVSTITTGAGDSTITTGAGNSTIITGAGVSSIHTGDGNETITTGAGDSTITTGAGVSTIIAGAGNEIITTGAGDSTITTGVGDSIISTGAGDSTITTGAGKETITTGAGDSTITTGVGDSTITTGAGNETITTGAGNETISTGMGSSNITTGAGNSTITTGAGDSTIITGAGNETISTGAGNNTITTGAGNSTITTAAGDSIITTGAGDSVVDVGIGNGTVTLGAGTNLVSYHVTNNVGTQSLFNASTGIDTLNLVLTRAEWMSDAVQTDVASYLSFLADNQGANGLDSAAAYTFKAFGLTASMFEKLRVTVDNVVLQDATNHTVALQNDTIYADQDFASLPHNVLENDAVPDLIKNVTFTSPANGSVQLNAAYLDTPSPISAQFIYTPTKGFYDYLAVGESASDTFTYTVTDAAGGASTATVNVIINGTNDAPVIAANMLNSVLNISAVNPFVNEILFTENFDGRGLSGHIGSYQFGTNLHTSYAGTLPNWQASGLHAFHEVERSPGNVALMIYGDNVATQKIHVAANELGQSYKMSFEIAPAGWTQFEQNSAQDDKVDILLISSSRAIIAHYQIGGGVMSASASFTPHTVDYIGDGSGEVHLVIRSANSGNNHFAGAIDNISISKTANIAPVTAQSIDLLAGATDVDTGDTANLHVANLTFTVDGLPTGIGGTVMPSGLALNGTTLTVDPMSASFYYLAQGQQQTIVSSYQISDVHNATVNQTQTITIVGVAHDTTLVHSM